MFPALCGAMCQGFMAVVMFIALCGAMCQWFIDAAPVLHLALSRGSVFCWLLLRRSIWCVTGYEIRCTTE